jgi:rare lipoprotein A
MTHQESTVSRIHKYSGGHGKRFAVKPKRVAMRTTFLFLASMTLAHANAQPSVSVGKQVVHASLSSPQKKKIGKHKSLSGIASYYGKRFHGRKTASGRPYSSKKMTAAHRTLPLGTWVKVTNERNGRSAVVQITDRGPFNSNRVIDVSLEAAKSLDMLANGLARVHLEVVPDYPLTKATDPSAEMKVALAD